MNDDVNPPRRPSGDRPRRPNGPRPDQPRRRDPRSGEPQPGQPRPRQPRPNQPRRRPPADAGADDPAPRQPRRRPPSPEQAPQRRPAPGDPRASGGGERARRPEASRRPAEGEQGRQPQRRAQRPGPEDARRRDPERRDPRPTRDPRQARDPRPTREPAAQPRRRSAPRPQPVYVDADGYEYDAPVDAEFYDTEYYDDDYYEDEWDDGGAGRGVMLVLGIVAVVLVAIGGYFVFGDQIRDFVDGGAPDYAGSGNGTEVLVSIEEGDTGADVARTLHEAGVVKSFDAFYDLLLANDMTFQPGVFSLEAEMSAQSAMNAFRDPTNRVTDRVVIREGLSAADAFALLSEASDIPVAEFEAAAADLAALGVPAEAPSIEGFLFPATYEVEPTSTAAGLVKGMVDKMIAQLDAAGVAPEDRFDVVTLASIIQREAGSVEEDFYKVSRVFHNRLDDGMRLQSDATVAYGRGHYDSVFTTADERADESNPYNTYAHAGLPVGPIGLPGDLAIDAAANPVDGPWLYFVTVNLETGETKFSETLEQHNAATRELQNWCHASEENASYCG